MKSHVWGENERSQENQDWVVMLFVSLQMIPQKKAATPGKAAAVTPNKKAAATPGKKATPAPTPAKKAAVTPAKKGAATPAKKTPVSAKGAKNGKNAKKEESEDEEDEDEEDEDEDSEEEGELDGIAPKIVFNFAPEAEGDLWAVCDPKVAFCIAAESEDEPMEITPAKGKKAAVLAKPTLKKATPAKVAKEESEEDDDDEEDDEDDEEDDDEEEEEEENVQETSGKRKKEMAKQKGTPDQPLREPQTVFSLSAFSVFLGNLNANKDFEELKAGIRDFFTKKDIEVQDVRLGGSKKFGYVDFPSEAEMDKALKLNGKKLMGLELKLEKAKSREKRDARTLFVKNLPFSVSKEDLQEEFDNAVEVRLVSRDGNSKGMAYIEFKSEAEAEKTLEEKQGLEMSGRAIVIDYTGEKSQQDTRKGGKGGQSDSKTLVVNNLSYDATEESLQEVFEKASAIRIPQNNQGRPKGFAFVDFATAEDAKEAMNSCNNTEIEGRAIRLEFSTQGGQNRNQEQSKTLFVKGLSEDTTEETLRESFDGSVGARIVTDRETGSSKGFGFVDFSSAEDAKAAKEAMEDGEIDGNKVTLDFAKPKGDGQRGGGGGGFGRGGRGGGGRGGGRGGFGRGGRGGGGDHKPQGKKIKFDD
uniref:Nucleolin n=1 Tax=Anolis carolinensis TaxID=28377 RepID=H9G4M1_ANOCA